MNKAERILCYFLISLCNALLWGLLLGFVMHSLSAFATAFVIAFICAFVALAITCNGSEAAKAAGLE